MSSVRVRFAPSPTGYVHVGNARTALFNWLFARHHQGQFILRIEDTDVERSRAEYESQLLDDLRWLGLDWDEGPDRGGPYGPYRQSERRELYGKFARQLIEAGQAYYCFCTPEQLEAERQAALEAGQQPKYSGRCRAIPPHEAERRRASGEAAAVRLKIPEGIYRWRDVVHGETSFSSEVMGDLILMRSSGQPAYNFAVVIDDHFMEISHVIRGDDHISNTPRQLALYRALGWTPPQFAHLSTILGPDRARLSKRHGATSLENFRQMGILPKALRNYLALLGWSPADGKTEILSTEQLITQFSLDHITKSPAVFDIKKLYAFNRHYISQINVGDFVRDAALRAWVERHLVDAGYLEPPINGKTSEWLFNRLFPLLAPSVDRLDELSARASVVFNYDAQAMMEREQTRAVVEQPGARQVLQAFISKVLAETELSGERFRAITKEVQKETGKKGKELFHPIRVALTGQVSGPELEKLIPLFEEGSKLRLKKHVKSCAERLREFQAAAKL